MIHYLLGEPSIRNDNEMNIHFIFIFYTGFSPKSVFGCNPLQGKGIKRRLSLGKSLLLT